MLGKSSSCTGIATSILLETGHSLHKRKLAAMLATYVGKYVLDAPGLDISKISYHFMGRVDCQ